ncbi:unnamed protein product [Closterium sp. Yama58-4]|nr:unnamed protein product [Closterium sp. Yama58-4]
MGLTSLPPSFCHLTTLEALYLVDCFELWELPEGFCRLTALKALCITGAERLQLPEDDGAYAILEDHRLYGSADFLPDSIAQLPSLTSLELDCCYPVWLPRRIRPSSLLQLTGLKRVKITGCRSLSEVPASLDTLVGLKSFELTDCEELDNLPAGLPPSLETLCLGAFKEGSSHVVDISQLSQLRVLKLNCVGVQGGPAVSSRLLCLQQLEQLEMRLAGNSQQLPLPPAFLPRLRSLLIAVPGIRRLWENLAAAMPELRQLELLSWSRKELPRSILEHTSLTSLTINAPRLVALPQGMSRLSQLRKLELICCNAMQHLPERLTQLRQLILRETSIRSLPANFVQLIPDSTGEDD